MSFITHYVWARCGGDMTDWLNRNLRVTAAKARRVTGISTPFGGMQWSDPGPSDTETVRQFMLFLEDRRVLFNAMNLEVPEQVDRSINEIRKQCTTTMQSLAAKAFAVLPIRAIRAAGQRFHDDRNEEFRFFDRREFGHGASPGFFTALGAYRAAVGYHIAVLAAHYDIAVEGDLARVLPALGR